MITHKPGSSMFLQADLLSNASKEVEAATIADEDRNLSEENIVGSTLKISTEMKDVRKTFRMLLQHTME